MATTMKLRMQMTKFKIGDRATARCYSRNYTGTVTELKGRHWMRLELDDGGTVLVAVQDSVKEGEQPDAGARVKALRSKWTKGRDDSGDAADQVVRVLLRRYPHHQVDAFTDNVAARASNPNQHYQALLNSGENVIHQHFDRWLKEAE